MNVLPAHEPIDPRVWDRPQLRVALARHDISEVYRLLGTVGVSQRQIAALTGQNQSEISDINHGRQVQAYDLLARIADGLGIPRGYMGLSYADAATHRLATSAMINPEDYLMERRTFLGLVSKIVMGAALTPAELAVITAAPATTPVPHQVGITEVTQLHALTSALRAHDAAHGGGTCRDAILAQAAWAESLLTASCSEQVRRQLLSAVADAKTLAGWAAHDLGLAREARQHLAGALRLTQQAENSAHSAVVLYHLGRVPLDNGEPAEALRLFQLGHITAHDSRTSLPMALLLVNEAMAHAHLGDARQAITALRRAEDEYTHTTDDEWPEFLRFFDFGALHTHAARVHSQLGLTDATHRKQAIDRLNHALADVPAGRARQRAFNLAWLATCTLADGDPTTGAQLGNQTLKAVQVIRSTRMLDHLAPLHHQAQRYPRRNDLRQLTRDLEQLRSRGQTRQRRGPVAVSP